MFWDRLDVVSIQDAPKGITVCLGLTFVIVGLGIILYFYGYLKPIRNNNVNF